MDIIVKNIWFGASKESWPSPEEKAEELIVKYFKSRFSGVKSLTKARFCATHVVNEIMNSKPVLPNKGDNSIPIEYIFEDAIFYWKLVKKAIEQVKH